MCPEVGELRRSLDEPVASVEAHLSGCSACRGVVADLRKNAAFAAQMVARIAPAAPTDVGARVTPIARASRTWRVFGAGLAAAVLVAVVATVPAAQTAAAQFLAQFRSQRFAAVQVDPASGQSVFAHFKELGLIQDSQRPRTQPVGSLAEASQRVGFELKQADAATLPAGTAATPQIQVSPAHQLRFTFQKAKAQQYLQRVGRPDFAVPDRLDGTTLVINVPAAALLAYRGAGPDEAMMVGQAGEVVAGVEGSATLEELRDYLLSLPGLPPEAVRQLRAIQDWRTTLPIPVPVANMAWRDTTVGGAPALILSDPTGLGAGVIWQQGGRIYGVAGNVRSEDVLRVANGLR